MHDGGQPKTHQGKARTALDTLQAQLQQEGSAVLRALDSLEKVNFCCGFSVRRASTFHGRTSSLEVVKKSCSTG
ncbi:MAG: hypothetical protein ABS94_29200 [Variovorax sp. SCN 67-85]|nr:MAG: hypothetical protein ABS94_29200 [Variovorax sp. SCN 67-85]ODV19629.1 MAG: hypothetical protein ABT25_26275 [Variovorax sp. SCN 67-20]